MSNPLTVARRIASRCFLPIACSVVLGLAFTGAYTFDRSFPGFQFVMTPIIASVYYYLLVYLKLREAHAGLFVLFLLTLLTTESMAMVFIFRDFWYVAAIAAAMFVYWKYFRSGSTHQSYPVVVLAGLYAITYIVGSVIHLSILRMLGIEEPPGSYSNIAAMAAFFGVLIGGAIGAGMELTDRLLTKNPS